jgi:hypothetical protein
MQPYLKQPYLKVLIARLLARRIEIRRRRLRRALRDYQRAELRRISAADRRARGLRLYAAWACKEDTAVDCGTIVPLEASLGVEEMHGQKIRMIRNVSA